jgi:hypothetical protein
MSERFPAAFPKCRLSSEKFAYTPIGFSENNI